MPSFVFQRDGDHRDLLSFPTRRSSDLTSGGACELLRHGENCLTYPPGEPEPLARSEEHTSELQSLRHLACRLLFSKETVTTEIYSLSLHDALPISLPAGPANCCATAKIA